MRQLNVPNLYFATVLILLIYTMWTMTKPFLEPIIFASIITGSVHPLYKLLLDKTHLTRKLAAVMMCLIVTLVIFFPLIYLAFALSNEAVTLYQNLTVDITNESVKNFFFDNRYIAGAIKSLNALLGTKMNIDQFINEILNQVKNFTSVVIVTVNSVVENIMSFLFDFVIMLLVVYALLTEGPRLKAFFLELSPLPDDQEQLIIDKFNQMNFVTLVCNGLGGLIQGILAGIGFWIAGIELVVLWTTIMIILAFVPLLGISMIYIPACIYLAATGKTAASIGLFVYCSLLAFVTENWFKPLFIGNRIQINALLVLFTIIGGMTVFGIGGIFYGPIIAILFLTMVELYHKFYSAR